MLVLCLVAVAHGLSRGNKELTPELLEDRMLTFIDAINDSNNCEAIMNTIAVPKLQWDPVVFPGVTHESTQDMCQSIAGLTSIFKSARLVVTGKVKTAVMSNMATIDYIWHVETQDGSCMTDTPGVMALYVNDKGLITHGSCIDDAELLTCLNYMTNQRLENIKLDTLSQMNKAMGDFDNCEEILSSVYANDVSWSSPLGDCGTLECFCEYFAPWMSLDAHVRVINAGQNSVIPDQSLVAGNHIWYIAFEDCELEMHGTHWMKVNEDGLVFEGACFDDLASLGKCPKYLPPLKEEL